MTSGTLRLAFLDLVFNLLLGITLMFILAFLMINPPTQGGQIDPPIRFMVEMEWDDESYVDIDLWVQGKDRDWVGFTRMDGSYFVLERDDRGTQNDTIMVDGEQVVISRNYENIRFTILPPGEYFVNVHYYSSSGPTEDITINLTMLNPFRSVFTDTVTLDPSQETTVVSFIVGQDGKITDLRTNVQVRRNTLPPSMSDGNDEW